MSFMTWHNYGYGVCVSDIKSESVERLKELLHLAPVYEAKIYKWFEEAEIADEDRDYEAFMDFDENYRLGLATILREVVEEAEGIGLVACDDFDGRTYLIYSPSYPWELSEREKALTEDNIRVLIGKYVRIFTDEEITISYQEVENGG